MTLDEFETGLDRWGGELEAWPLRTRAEAETLLAASPPARRALDAMRAVEHGLIRTARHAQPGLDTLIARVTAQPQQRVAALAWRLRYAGCMAVLLAGFAYGALQPSPAEDWFAQAFASAEPFDVN